MSNGKRRSGARSPKSAGRAERTAAIPDTFHYPSQLPIAARAEEILALLRQHQVLVVAGDTGSGKTTQLPKICLQAGLGRHGLIGHTQPRRLATVAVANRVAEELGVALGEGVGYQVRFRQRLSAATFLKIMTDGVLLSEIQHDRYLRRYEAILLDEAHERSLNIDFLLGYLKWLLGKRSDLKLIITSATIDVAGFSRHFNQAPTILIAGRTYPVEVRYAPLHAEGDSPEGADWQWQGILSAIGEIAAEERARHRSPGDILVFLATERDIRDTAAALRRQGLPHTEVLPLYARLRQGHSVFYKLLI